MFARTLLISAAVALAAAAPSFAIAAPAASQARASDGRDWARDYAYVLLNAGSDSVSMSGSMEDVRRARELRAGDEPLLYVRQGGVSYVIRNPAMLRRADALFAPQEALGRQQAELGARQAALGRQQARLGAEQAAVAYRRVGDSPEEAASAARRQGELGRQQGELGRQQGELGRRQGELGRQQGELARAANRELQVMVDEAIRSGQAQRVD